MPRALIGFREDLKNLRKVANITQSELSVCLDISADRF